jgi:hypothetical protein
MARTTSHQKTTNNHTTLTKTAEEVLETASKLDEVTKISAGVITSVKGSRRALKFLPIVGGIKAAVRGSGAVQEIFIYTKTPEETAKVLLKSFGT